MGKLRFARDVVKTILAIIREAPKGNSVRIERKVPISCALCGKETTTVARFDVGARGLWRRDPIAPEGWGIRYKRREGMAPLPTYYCSTCAQVMAGKKS
jgi:hypothetical protein